MPDGLAVSTGVGSLSALALSGLAAYRQTYPSPSHPPPVCAPCLQSGEWHRVADVLERLESLPPPVAAVCPPPEVHLDCPWWIGLLGGVWPALHHLVLVTRHPCRQRAREPAQQRPPPAVRDAVVLPRDLSEEALIRSGARNAIEWTPNSLRKKAP